jgi:hypothetical protein
MILKILPRSVPRKVVDEQLTTFFHFTILSFIDISSASYASVSFAWISSRPTSSLLPVFTNKNRSSIQYSVLELTNSTGSVTRLLVNNHSASFATSILCLENICLSKSAKV